MFATCRVLFVLALGVGFVGVPTARADEKKGEKPTKPQPAAEPAKPIVIYIDAGKLPPDVLKQLFQLAEKPKPGAEPVKPTDKPKPGATAAVKPGTKPGTKPAVEPGKPTTKPAKGEPAKPGTKVIGLADAVAIAEKTTKGTVVKAERDDEGGRVEFKLEVVDAKGGKSKLTLDAGGNLMKKGDKGEK